MRIAIYTSNDTGPAAGLLRKLFTVAGHAPRLRSIAGCRPEEWEGFDAAVLVVDPHHTEKAAAIAASFEARGRLCLPIAALVEDATGANFDQAQLAQELAPLAQRDPMLSAGLTVLVSALAASSAPADPSPAAPATSAPRTGRRR